MSKTASLESYLSEQSNRVRPDKTSSLSWMDFRTFRPRRISERERADFFTQLSVLLESRVTLHRALRILQEQANTPAAREFLGQVASDVERGNSFDQAMGRHPSIFSQLMIVTAEVGQESGMLPEVLSDLSRHIEKMYALKRKFSQAMAYPLLVLIVALLAVVFLLIFIVPSFAEMFHSFQIELPASTRLVLALSEGLTSAGPVLLIAAVILVLASGRVRKSKFLLRTVDRYRYTIPMVGSISLKTAVARFCRTLGTMLRSQVSLIEALQTTQRINESSLLREEIGHIIDCVRRGKSVAEPLSGSGLFPPMVVQMIAVGEETSELDAMLLKVADHFERDLDRQIEMFSSVLEPLIIVILGFVIAAILIAMYMPMFDLVNVLN
jgi:type IV pilus assembly protein PilC